ncbi:transposase [bacterium AH-315-F03]|nr:transposase [bacterium AH-315-F03]
MTNIRRHFAKGQVYSLTHVTHKRRPILVENADLVPSAFKRTGVGKDYKLLAWSILPDHLHLLIDPLDSDLANLTRRIKLIFSAGYRSKYKLKFGRLWQYRYWDHIIRDDIDMNNHIDYIHYNAVKHGLVIDPFEYEYSSIHEYAERGLYQRDWGCNSDPTVAGNYGE